MWIVFSHSFSCVLLCLCMNLVVDVKYFKNVAPQEIYPFFQSAAKYQMFFSPLYWTITGILLRFLKKILFGANIKWSPGRLNQKGQSISKVNLLRFKTRNCAPVMAKKIVKCSTLDVRLSNYAGHCLPVNTQVQCTWHCILMALSWLHISPMTVMGRSAEP